MTNISINKVNLQDLEELQNISKQTFYETFSESNSTEDMEKYLVEELSTEKLTSELKDINSEFYFAKNENTLIGYLKLNFSEAQTEIKDENSLEIERIYILKEFQGKRFGQILFKYVIELAKAKKKKFIWLGVWEENRKAINFYQKNGFVEFGKHIFKLGNDEQTDLLMKFNL